MQAQVVSNKTISLNDTKKVVAEAVKFAKNVNAPSGSIAVVDAGGNLIYLERSDGTFAASAEVFIKKTNTAATLKLLHQNWETQLMVSCTASLSVFVQHPK